VLSGPDETNGDYSTGVRVLAEARRIFDERGDRLSSAAVAEGLHAIEESPWGEWYGRPISPHAIARLLGPFDIRPQTVRVDKETTAKGYKREQFEDARARLFAV
jgi:Protein of unknown function (DUF3631)